jgi:NADH-quinone oxidoreductase subunit L
MMFPLYVLAFLSIFVGIVLGPTHYFEKFMEPSVAHLEIGPLMAGTALMSETAGWIVSGAVAILGLALAWVLYGKAKATGELVSEQAKARNPIYWFLADKWCFDRLYNFVFITLGGKFADRVLWQFVDVKIIDGTFSGLAGLIARMSSGIRRVQTGYVRNYALGILFGVVALIVGLLAQWSSVHTH